MLSVGEVSQSERPCCPWEVRGEDSGFVLLCLNQGSGCFLVCTSGESFGLSVILSHLSNEMKGSLLPQVLNIEPRALFMLNTYFPSQVLFLWHQIDEAKAQCLAPNST